MILVITLTSLEYSIQWTALFTIDLYGNVGNFAIGVVWWVNAGILD